VWWGVQRVMFREMLNFRDSPVFGHLCRKLLDCVRESDVQCAAQFTQLRRGRELQLIMRQHGCNCCCV
jgi:hypothetical protein